MEMIGHENKLMEPESLFPIVIKDFNKERAPTLVAKEGARSAVAEVTK
jgi:hypothetical protein